MAGRASAKMGEFLALLNHVSRKGARFLWLHRNFPVIADKSEKAGGRQNKDRGNKD
jgi:hypothetical protein